MMPLKITVTAERTLRIEWDDNTISNIKLSNLRMHCPCALCSAERENQSKTYIPLYSDEESTPKGINLVGNYAISVAWKDDHNTGIYEFGYLRKL